MLPVARMLQSDVVLGRRRPVATYRRPLIAADLDASQFARLATTARAALGRDAHEVVVVHACSAPFSGMRLLLRTSRLAHEIEAAARDFLRRAAAASDPAGHYDIVTRCGDPATVVLAEASARGCDLIVVGAGRSRLWRRHALADRLLAHAACDIAIVGGSR